MAGKRGFGSIRKLPSGAFQARYTGPDGAVHKAAHTFQTKGDADAWLAGQRTDISRDAWKAPSLTVRDDAVLTFGGYALRWLEGRELKPRTRDHYRSLIDSRLIPAFGERPLDAITGAEVRAWHSKLDPKHKTIRAHAYALLRTIYGTAVSDELVPVNPCRIKGAGSSRRQRIIRAATLPELEAVTANMPERLRPMVLLAAWCALRFGELAELRRGDVDLKHGLLRIRRGVTRVGTDVIVGTPKSEAGIRDVAIPPHLLPMLKAHLAAHVEPGRDALLFPAADGRNIAPSTLYGHWYPARTAAGRPDLRFHDLRHTGAVLAASTGATLAELMARLGHSTPAAAMKYQHAAADRDRVIADALSALATMGGPSK